MGAPDDDLVARLRATPKYQGVCDDLLRWAVSDAGEGARSDKERLKVAKRKLHQAFGAFLDASRRKQVLRRLDSLTPSSPDGERRAALAACLPWHASTAERLDHHEALWAFIRAHTGPIDSVVDLGCGLGPALLPWSGLARSVRFVGWDLDGPLCDALERALQPMFPRVNVAAVDVRTTAPPAADVTLCWKLLPTLERQQAGAARALLARLAPTTLVATFPTRSLTGKARGMASTYRGLADRLLGPGTERAVGDELVRIVSWPPAGDGC